MRVRAAPLEHYAWLCRRVGYAPTREFRAIEAVRDDGHILGMVGYDHWSPNAVWMHVALVDECPRGGLRGFVRAAFAYPFVEAGREIVLGSVRGGNVAAQRLDLHLGFREVCRIVDGVAKGEDLIFYEMRKADCRWLGRKAA